MDSNYTIRSISDIIQIGKKLPLSWFRGHPQEYHELTPGIFRKDIKHQHTFKPDFENRIYSEFKRIAPGLSDIDLRNFDSLEWLFLMQHHGLKTRLLDWTESILFAAYFTVEKDFKENGELWCMYPDALNHQHGFHGMPVIGKNRNLDFLASEYMHTNPPQLAKELKLEDIPKCPMALLPPMKFNRMILQQSTFTIHPYPENGKTIQDVLKKEKILVRYTIPKGVKRGIKADLRALGINRRTLFGDLDSLSIAIIDKENIMAYNPPGPPKLGKP
ncbi:MAG: FRG domain-containing protein [Nitrosopumilus sp.]